jgi:hypothetical protein
MTQIQQLGFLANNLTVNTSANTATFNNILVVGNSSINVVINSSSVYVSGSPVGGGTNVAAQYAWTNTQSYSAVITHTANVSVNGAIIANGGAGTSGQVLTSAAGGNVYWASASSGANLAAQTAFTNTAASTNATSGALQISGGLGVIGNVYTKGVVGFSNATNISVVYMYYNSTVGAIDTVFG